MSEANGAITEKVGQLIKAARKSKKMTQKELGERLGITEFTVSKYESGKENPTILTLHRIAESLGYDLEIFFKIK